MSKFYGIGVGPGDSGLVTVKGSRLINELDILYTPEAKMGGKSLALSIASPYVNDHLEIKQRHFPMVREVEGKIGEWTAIANEIVEDVQAGKTVGFITLGDPMVYSTYSYLLDIIGDRIEVETVPGITSYNSIASVVNTPLVIDEETFAIVPATAGADKLDAALQLHETVVIMKVSNHLKVVLPILEKHGLLEKTIMVSNSSSEKQVVTFGVQNLSADEKLTYFTTMIVKK